MTKHKSASVPLPAHKTDAADSDRSGKKRAPKQALAAPNRESVAVSRFFAYLDREQSKAEEILRKAGYRNISELIRDPLIPSRTRFGVDPSCGAIDVMDLPDGLMSRGKAKGCAFELLGWLYETHKLIERSPREMREVLIRAFWLGGNANTAQIGLQLPEIGKALESLKGAQMREIQSHGFKMLEKFVQDQARKKWQENRKRGGVGEVTRVTEMAKHCRYLEIPDRFNVKKKPELDWYRRVVKKVAPKDASKPGRPES